ncbi:hypothetical protein DOTSEDRAFT_45959 [Dothistroma septosporum NZE10]|uniref:Uncharacterized protein n=1 Tax=Dothistroma septosporum (strain NZE10 / CBS 128990) TaxID=675120 RepID=N1PII7_DOTSN|nr:hypothetical protein DOTSEDRAFT_45959 [Dothistroma septosporum NZE10]
MTDGTMHMNMIDFVDVRRAQSYRWISELRSGYQVDDATCAEDCFECETSWYCAECKRLYSALQAQPFRSYPVRRNCRDERDVIA